LKISLALAAVAVDAGVSDCRVVADVAAAVAVVVVVVEAFVISLSVSCPSP
jgi:hypothetical protein